MIWEGDGKLWMYNGHCCRCLDADSVANGTEHFYVKWGTCAVAKCGCF